MHKTLIAIVTVTALTAVGATAFAAQPSKATGDELFLKANSTSAVAEKAEPLKGVNIKKIAIGDDNSGSRPAWRARRDGRRDGRLVPRPPQRKGGAPPAPPFSRPRPCDRHPFDREYP